MRRGFELTPVNVRALVRLAASTDRTAASARTAQTLALSTRSAGTGPHRHQVNDLASACPSHGARPCTPHAQRERNPTPPPYRRAHTRPQARHRHRHRHRQGQGQGHGRGRGRGTGPHRHQVKGVASACPLHGARPCTPHAQRERNPAPPPYRRAHTQGHTAPMGCYSQIKRH
jgi:hypothetical protein